MTLHYVDSSAWVKCYYSESGTDWIRKLIRPEQGRRLACATLGFAEVASALVRRQAAHRITVGGLAEIFEALESDWRRFYRILVDEELSMRAVALTSEYRLRGADAVHLAAIQRLHEFISQTAVSLIFVCADTELNNAAQLLGFTVMNPTTLETHQ